jgi:small-conductance mechanosensitive channel
MGLTAFIPAALTLGIGVAALITFKVLSDKRDSSDSRLLVYQLLIWVGSLILLIAVIVALPLENSIRGQILSLVGVVLTAIIALSSTTFVANAMAGIMLQATKPFRPGDFILVNGVFGQVTRIALVSTRIQTETRDFTNLPNLLLVTHPITVQHREGTIIQADVSLGYDIHHRDAEHHLLSAASKAGFSDPYVLVLELLDHAVSYRVAGFLIDVKNPLSARSALRRHMLDELHLANVEITSPSVVAQRQQPGDTRTLAKQVAQRNLSGPAVAPEEKIFDSANAAANQEQLRQEIRAAKEAISESQEQIKKLQGDDREDALVTLRGLEQKLRWLEAARDAGSTD